MTRQQQEDIRLGFVEKHRGEPALASVGVRQTAEGEFYIAVGLVEEAPLEDSYEGLPVRTSRTARAVNAVQPAAL